VGTSMSSSALKGAGSWVPGARRSGPEQPPTVTGSRRRRLGWVWAGAGTVVNLPLDRGHLETGT